MELDLLEVMCSMYRVQGLQVLKLNDAYDGIEQIDYGFRGKMFEQYDYLATISSLERFVHFGTIYQVEDDLKLYYLFLRLPKHLACNYSTQLLILGPVLFHPLSASAFHELMKDKQIPLEHHWEVQEFYNRIPVISSYDAWYNTAYFFLSRICNSAFDFCAMSYHEAKLFPTSYEDYQIPPLLEIAQKNIEDRYEMEAAMLQAVSIGDLRGALEAQSHFRQHKILPRTPDPIRNEKNLMITLNTLLRKSAQLGGVHPLHVDNLSRQIAIQVESSSTTAQLGTLPSMMVRKYCMLVKNYSRKAYSSLVQTCMDYIDFHYMEDLSLKTMAQFCSVSNSYLSTLFRKEAELTMTDYINTTRIRRSLTLLNTTTLSVQEIATQCGFSDANYYTRTFKKVQGKSPKQYRAEIRPNV